MRDARPAWLPCAVSAGIGTFAISLALYALRRKNQSVTSVAPVAKCFVSGLLCGLALLVMLPSAMEHTNGATGYQTQHVLMIFCCAALFMFFVHHVLLDHQHEPPAQGQVHSACAAGCGPPGLQGKGKLLAAFKPQISYCPPVRQPPDILPTAMAFVTPNCRATEGMSVLLRALPYTIHACIDGLVLSTAHSTTMLLQLALPILLCSVQDVGTIIVTLSVSGASQRTTLQLGRMVCRRC